MIEKYTNLSPIYLFENLSKYKDICHFVSTRIGGISEPPYGSLNLGFHVGDDQVKVLKNRKILASDLGVTLDHFTFARQVHKGNVTIVTEEMRGKGATDYQDAISGTDAMMTNIPNIYLTVLVADCVPILLFDPIRKVIGSVHAGWRGTLELIAQNSVNTLRKKFGSIPSDIIVGIGPSIGPCCYEVGSELIAQVENIFHTKEGYINNESADGKGYFNLWKANKRQLIQAGISEENIEVAEICTYCHADLFFSVRHQKGETGRFGAGIMIKRSGFQM